MKIGELNKRVQLQSSSAGVKNGFGEAPLTWTTYATVWAGINPQNGEEVENAQQVKAVTTFEIKIRYNAVVSPLHRIKFGTRNFEIEAILNYKERNELLIMTCKEIY